MKRRIIVASIMIAAIAYMFPINLQSQPRVQPPMSPKQRPMPPGELIEVLKEELNLTSEQELKIQEILDAQALETKKMAESEKKERNALRKKMEKQRKETDAKISALLTDEQKKIYEKLQKKRHQRPPHPPKPENERPEYPDRNE
ncbi:MAG: hypothetical protein JXA06_12875 [Bacteroidetes bacterium]|nr:hypothetical protein [Bacteroidota bacterium]